MKFIKYITAAITLAVHLGFAQETSNFETVSHNLISANVSDIEVRDGLAYCAGDYGLSVWSLEDPDTLEFVSRCQTPGDAVAVALRGDYAYLADAGRGVAIINISNPEEPRFIDEFEYQMTYWGAPVNIGIHDTLLLVSNTYDGLVIASLTDPENPEIIMQGEFEGGAYTNLLIKDNYLFINDFGTRAVLVVDVTDFDNPELITEIRNYGFCRDLAIQNDLLILAGSDTLFFYSIADPEQPEKLGYVPANLNGERKIEIIGNRLVASGDGIRVCDISNPSRPILTDFIRNGSEGNIEVVGDRVYSALGQSGISIVSIENPRDLRITGRLYEGYQHIFVCKSGDLVFLFNHLFGLRIVDVSNPTSPELVSELAINGPDNSSGGGVLLRDNILYFKLYDLLNLIDVSDIENPRVMSQLEIIGNSLDLSLVDDYLIVTGWLIRDGNGVIDGNILVVDVSDPENPHAVFNAADGEGNHSRYPGVILNGILYQLTDIEGQGGYIKEVLVYSLDNPAHPRLMGRWPQADYSLLLAAGGLLYSHFDNGDFVGYSVDDALEPEMVGVLRLNGANNLASTCWAVDGDLVYLGSYWDNLVAISVVDPQNPRLVGYCNTPGSVCDMKGEDGLLYVADRNNFGIYRFTGDIGEGGDENLYRIAIDPGWNFVSAPIRPNIRNIVSIFNPIAASLTMAKDYLGRFYVPARPFNNIPFWDYHQGYQVKLRGRASLPIAGEPVAADTPIRINSSWYLAPYYPDLPQEPEVAFANIRDQLRLAKDEGGNFYIPAQNFNNMPRLRRGNAYFIQVSENVELVWNVDQERLAAEEVTQPSLKHFPLPLPTCASMSLLINGLNSIGEVGVFAEGGLIVGAGRSNIDGQCGIAVWGDDPTTEKIDGALEGEVLIFKLWDGQVETPALLKWEGDSGTPNLEFISDELAIGEITHGSLKMPFEFALYDPYPNPFNSSTIIRFGLDKSAPTRLVVYDLSGRVVADLMTGRNAYPPGEHSVVWDASGVPTGVYLCWLEAGDRTMTRKIVLVR